MQAGCKDWLSISVLTALMAACGGGGGSSVGVGPPTSSEPQLLAQANIGPSGGSLVVAEGASAGLELTIPPGAVVVPTMFRVLLEDRSGELPSEFPIYRFEPSAIGLNGQSVSISLPFSEAFLPVGGSELAVFRRDVAGESWSALVPTSLDVGARIATTSAARLGDMAVLNGNLYRLFSQPHGFIDPAVDAKIENVGGVEVIVGEGSIERQIGRGSLVSFWNSSQAQNVIILHGALGSPLDFLGPEDLVENLALSYDNVLLYAYPSARGIAYAANALYDYIQANRKPGFGCRIVGHSLGALIGRYLLERSHVDVNRLGFDPTDPSLVPIVDKLVLMAPPNAGAAAAVAPFAVLEGLLAPEESQLLQTADDLSERADSLPLLMNASYFDNATRYHTIYGDIGDGSDGVVPAASALALPLGAGETATLYAAQHDDLHRLATSLGIAVWMGSVMQAQ